MVEWFNFLDKFPKETVDFNLSKENDRYFFEAYNVFNLDIKLNTKYGFMVMLFNDEKTKNKFLEISNIHINPGWIDGIQHVNINWDNTIFPSRVFLEKKKILFYDEKNNDSNSLKYEKRMIVFKNIIKALVDIKSE
jgi:hypothetical protein